MCVCVCVCVCVMQQAPNGFSEFCVRDIDSAEHGRREIQLAERGICDLFVMRSDLAVPEEYPGQQ